MSQVLDDLVSLLSMEQLEENLGALEVLPRLTQDVMDRIDQIFPKPVLPEY